jgi:hypothetical protein
MPSSCSSCRDSRTRWQLGQVHPSTDTSCGLNRDSMRVVAGCAEPRAARHAWAPWCVREAVGSHRRLVDDPSQP